MKGGFLLNLKSWWVYFGMLFHKIVILQRRVWSGLAPAGATWLGRGDLATRFGCFGLAILEEA